MSVFYLGCIIFSAFWHAFYNFLLKKKGGDLRYLQTMLVFSAVIAFIIMLVTGSYGSIPWNYVLYVFGASFFYILYQVFTAKAYEKGNISALYPLTVLSPIFIPVWAGLFLSEIISVVTGIGIIVTIIGAIMVKLRAFTPSEFRKIFRFHKEYLGARFALAASFFYSIGAIFDKSKIAAFPVMMYLVILVFFMSLLLGIYMYFWRGESVVVSIKSYWKPGIIGGIALCLSFLFFRIALQKVFVSLVVPVRQVSIIFALLLGILFLKEKIETGKVVGALIIILGITLVTVGIK